MQYCYPSCDKKGVSQKVAQNQNISVFRTKKRKVKKYKIRVLCQSRAEQCLGNREQSKVALLFLQSEALSLSLELRTGSHTCSPLPSPKVTASVCKLFKYFGSGKAEVGYRGMNFQSIAWQISRQITLPLMGFVGISFMLCFENSFLSIYWRTWGKKSVSLEGVCEQFKFKKKKKVFLGPPISSLWTQWQSNILWLSFHLLFHLQ